MKDSRNKAQYERRNVKLAVNVTKPLKLYFNYRVQEYIIKKKQYVATGSCVDPNKITSIHRMRRLCIFLGNREFVYKKNSRKSFQKHGTIIKTKRYIDKLLLKYSHCYISILQLQEL